MYTLKGPRIQMWKLRYTDAYLKIVSWNLCIFNPYGFWVICHLSSKHSLLFNTFNSFNVNTERFQIIYRTDII